MRMADPTTVLGSIEVLNQDVVNLDPSDFEFKRVTVPLAECCLIYQSCNAAVRSQTRIHEDFGAFAILGPHSRGSINGLALHPYAMIAAKPSAEAEIVVDKNYESVAWLVPPQIIDKHLASRWAPAVSQRAVRDSQCRRVFAFLQKLLWRGAVCDSQIKPHRLKRTTSWPGASVTAAVITLHYSTCWLPPAVDANLL